MHPSIIKQPLGVFTQPNEGNGDCLFSSIAQALNAYKGAAHETLATHVRALGLALGSIRPTELRQLTYRVFLAPHPDTDSIIDSWRAMLFDDEMRHEYGQARVLPAKPAAELTAAERRAFYDACMNPVVCWGDETALAFLERLLSIRCLVITNRVMQTRQFAGHRDDFVPIVFVPVNLAHRHYQSVTWFDADGVEHTAFSETELPDVLLFMAMRDCSRAKEEYITLRRRTDFRAAMLRGEIEDTTPYEARAPTFDDTFICHYQVCARDFFDMQSPPQPRSA